jgi:hypothetical protein
MTDLTIVLVYSVRVVDPLISDLYNTLFQESLYDL